MVLLMYQATPLPWCGHKLSMGRPLRSTVPQPTKHFVPKWTYIPEFKLKNAEFKRKQNANFDGRHQTREASDIPDDTDVWVNTGPEPVRGTVTASTDQPRLYRVETPSAG